MSAGQILQFGLTGGLAENIDPKQTPPGTLELAENCIRRKSGLVEKRSGTKALAQSIVGGGTISAGARLLTRGSELGLIDGASLYSYSSNASAWRRVDKVPDVAVASATLIDPYQAVAMVDSAVSSAGLLVAAWTTGSASTGGQLFVQVTVLATGQTLLAPQVLSTAATNIGVRVLVIGTTAVVLTNNPAAPAINAWTVNLATLAVAGPTALKTDQSTTATCFDACVIGSNFVIAYPNSAFAIQLHSFTSALVAVNNGSVANSASVLCLSIDGALGESLYVAFATSTTGAATVSYGTADATSLTQTNAPITVESVGATTSVSAVGVCRYDSSHAIVAFSGGASTSAPANIFRTATYQVTNAGALVANTRRGTCATSLACRPFMAANGNCYLMVVDSVLSAATTAVGTLNSYLVEAEISSNGGVGATVFPPHRYVAQIEHAVAAPSSALAFQTLPSAYVNGSSITLAQRFLASVSQSYAANRAGARLLSLSTYAVGFAGDRWRSVTFGQETYVAGGVLAAYDGRALFDYAFPNAPLLSGVVNSGSGGFLAAGTYIYGAVCEYRSSAGVLHRSSPAVPVSVTTSGSTSSVALTIVRNNLSLKQDLTTGFGTAASLLSEAVPFRTTVGGLVPQRLSVEPLYNVIPLDASANAQTFTDTRLDTSLDGSGAVKLATQPAIYSTSGAVLGDEQPPAFMTLTLHKQRLWGVDATGRQVWFSKSFLDDYGSAPGFSSSFLIQFDSAITALLSMDDKLVALGTTQLWYLVGDGPTSNGLNSDYGTPSRIQSDVGCTNARSVASIPDGVVFLSARGIYLLTRGLELVFIGRPIQDELLSYPNITSATLVPALNQVRFTANNATNTSGIVLVYDYAEKIWSTAKYWDGATYGCPIADALLWNGVWTFVTPTGTVYSEDATTCLDAGSKWVPQSWAISSVSATGPLGYQRVRRGFILGDRVTDCDLTLSFDYDDKGTFPQSYTWKSDAVANSSVGGNIGMRCGTQNGANPRCRSFSMRVTDAAPTGPGATIGTGKGCTFSAIGLEIVPRPGMQRRSANART